MRLIKKSAIPASTSTIPRSAAAAEGRDPRPTAAEGSDRPKAAIDGGRRPASGRVEPAEPVQRRQFRSEKAPSTRPCVFRRLYAPATPCCFPAAPYAMAWRLCDLPEYPPAALMTNRNRSLPPTSVRCFWAQEEQQPFPGASQRRPLPGDARPAPLSPSTCGAVAHRWGIMGPLCVKV